MASYSTVTGLYRHKHTDDVAEGGSLTNETKIDSISLTTYIMVIAMVLGG